MNGPRRRAFLAAAAALIAACALPAAAARAADPLSPGALYRDVVRYARLGPVHHLTGTAPEDRTLGWLRDELSATGMQTGTDGVDFYAFLPRRLTLTVAGRPVHALAAWFYSGTTGPGGVAAPLAYGGHGTPAELSRVDMKGRILVVDLVYAGENSIAPELAGAYAAAQSGGAVGFVGVSEGPGNFPVNEDSSSSGGPRGLPALFVGRRSGASVLAAAQAGRPARMVLEARVGRTCTANVWGVLPGRDPHRYVVVSTPSSGFEQAAAERGGGDAILLGLARRYAALPLAERPVTLVFAALSGHEVGVGIPTFSQMHPEWFGTATDAFVGLGASIGAAQISDLPDGQVRRYPFGDLSRWLYASENPLLQPGVQQAFAGAQPFASVPPGGFDPGEQQWPYELGIPIVAVSGAHYYFHTAGDTPRVVDPAALAAMARGFAGSVDYIAGLPAGALRAANGAAEALAAEQRAKGKDPLAGDPRYLPRPDAACAGVVDGAPGGGP